MFCSGCQILILSGDLFYDSINLKSLKRKTKQRIILIQHGLPKMKLKFIHSTRLCIYKLPILIIINEKTHFPVLHLQKSCCTSTSYTSKKPAAEVRFSNLNIKLEDHVQDGPASNPVKLHSDGQRWEVSFIFKIVRVR